MVNFSSPMCIAETTIIGVDKLLLSAVFLSFAFITFLALRRNLSTKSKIVLIYSHLTFLFFPFILLATNTTCGVFCLQCHNNYPLLITYALPATLVASTIAGLFAIPFFYTLSSRRELRNRFVREFVRRYSIKMNIETPKLYLVDKAKPVAFSFRSVKSAIFLSAGLFDILNKKEIEAVLLHELTHIKQKSSLLKLSSVLMMFSPFSLIAKFHESSEEEKNADNFAIKTQKTNRYLKSAKKKIDSFLCQKNYSG